MTNYTLVQSNTGSGTVGAGLTATITLGAGTTAGNKVVIAAYAQTTATTLAASGFNLDANPKVTGVTTSGISVFSKTAVGGETSWTITGFASSGETCTWKVFELAGLTTAGLDKAATNNGSGSAATTLATGTTATTTTANELAIAAVIGAQSSSSTAFNSWSNGYTQQGSIQNAAVSGATVSFGVAFLELTSIGTTSSTVTFNAAAFGCGCVCTYAESSTAPPPANFLPFF